jgi:hypothetical protein
MKGKGLTVSERRLCNFPESINEEGLKNLWRAVIKQAKEDLYTGVPVKRQLEAYHWLLTERSDLAFKSQAVYSEGFRDEIRLRLNRAGFALPQEPLTSMEKAA